MKDSKEDEWAKVQQTAHFMQGRAAVALRAAAAGKEPDDVSSHKKRKAEAGASGEGAGD
jgi:hypothetical protein